MRIIDPGHTFELDHLDGTGKTILDFVKRVGDKYPGNKGAHEGVIIQEVLRAIISRFKYVNEQKNNIANTISIKLLREVIWNLEVREKQERKEFSELDYDFLINQIDVIEDILTCKECGHIDCNKHKENK